MRKIKHGKMSGGCSDACCLKLEGVSVHIQGEDILEDVSFHLHCGEITALIGPNGAGKSTLFRSVLGQLSYQGNITFSPAGGPAIRLADGTVMGGTRPLIGYVPQSPTFDRGTRCRCWTSSPPPPPSGRCACPSPRNTGSGAG